MDIELNNIYYRQNKEVKEYKDIFLDTNIGVVRINVGSLRFVYDEKLESMHRLSELDVLYEKYGELYINEIRSTYDNDVFLLVSNSFLIAIEYILNSNFEHSVQEIRLIEDLQGVNKAELERYNELATIKIP